MSMENNYQAIKNTIEQMKDELSVNQLKKLQEVLKVEFNNTTYTFSSAKQINIVDKFIEAKTVEGCSERTLKEYRNSIEKLMSITKKDLLQITTEKVRQFLKDYQSINNCGNATIDNHRRNLSSFFTWLENEDYIMKSPMKRIAKIKVKKAVKKVVTDEEMEILKDNCTTKRDLAIIELLDSTGMRIGELVNLNKEDVDFENRECTVLGKGNKERTVYFNARAKVHLEEYLNIRKDENKALFVTLDKPHDRLKISGVEIRLRKLGRKLNIEKVHPHKFRRTMATRAIGKGMPVEQVQKLLGHNQIDTTMQYAMVNGDDVKYSHRKYLG